jgi:hypothetical protein
MNGSTGVFVRSVHAIDLVQYSAEAVPSRIVEAPLVARLSGGLGWVNWLARGCWFDSGGQPFFDL